MKIKFYIIENLDLNHWLYLKYQHLIFLVKTHFGENWKNLLMCSNLAPLLLLLVQQIRQKNCCKSLESFEFASIHFITFEKQNLPYKFCRLLVYRCGKFLSNPHLRENYNNLSIFFSFVNTLNNLLLLIVRANRT